MAISVCLLFKFVKFSASGLFASLQRSAGTPLLCDRVGRFSSSYVCAPYFGSRFLQAFPKDLQELIMPTCTPSSTPPSCLSPHLNLAPLSVLHHLHHFIPSPLPRMHRRHNLDLMGLNRRENTALWGGEGGSGRSQGRGMNVNTTGGTKFLKICAVPI